MSASGAGAPAFPQVASGTLKIWLRADAGVITSGDRVLQWQDQSTNVNHASQVVTDQQPLLINGAVPISGLPVVRFDGIQSAATGDFLEGTGDLGLASGYTSFAVYSRVDRVVEEQVIVLVGTPGGSVRSHYIRSIAGVDNEMAFSGWGNDYGTGFSIPSNTFRIWTERMNGTKTLLEFFDSNGSISFTNAKASSGLGTPSAGYFVGGLGNFTRNFQGDVAELIIFQGTLNDGDRSAVEDYLKQKYFQSGVPGGGSLTYQWQFNGTNRVGATSSSFVVTNAQIQDEGVYSVTVSNNFGGTTSSNAVLTFVYPPSIVSQPGNQTVLTGTNASFSVTATGTSPLSYQWIFNGAAIPNATGSNYVINSVQLTNVGNYSVLVSNVAGTTLSTPALLRIPVPPTIAIQPVGATVLAGTNIVFAVTAETFLPTVSSGNLRLWLRADAGAIVSNARVTEWRDQSSNGNHAFQTDTNKQPLFVGSTTTGKPTLRFDGIQSSATGDWLRGTNDVGIPTGYTSFLVYLRGNRTITEQVPAAIGVPSQSSALRSYFIRGSGEMALSAWSNDYGTGYNIPADTYRIWTDRLNNSKTLLEFFDVTATNVTSFARSTSGLNAPSAGYYIGGLDSFTRNFQGDVSELIVYQGSLTDTDRSAVENHLKEKYFFGVSENPLAYQWLLNGTNIVGATNSSLTLSNVQPANAGSYSVTITNLAGSITSSNAILTVITPPSIPRITSFSPGSGPVNATVTIVGENFSSVASNNIVWFGAVAAPVVTATANQLTVLVPSGANQAPIAVAVDGLVGVAPAPFVVTYLGAGTFSTSSLASAINLPAGQGPVESKIVDLDGDGKADLLVANFTANTLSVYRNISTNGVLALGSFAPKVDFATGTSPRHIVFGDIDGDGKRDVVVANFGSGTVSVFRNISTPGTFTGSSFAAKVDFATGTNPHQLALVDFNGDGKLDLAVANTGTSTLSVLRNTATIGSITGSSFAARVDFPAGAQPGGLAAGDIDGDGKPDLALSNDSFNSISIFRNTTTVGSSTITFAAKVDFATPSRPYKSVVLGDLDGDGKLDIAVATYLGGTVSVFRNVSVPGVITTNSLAARVDLPTGGRTQTVLVADVDGDSKSDLVAVSENSNAISVFRNRSTNGTLVAGSFAPRVDFATGSNPQDVSVGDLDSDGRPDVVTAASFGDVVSVHRNLNSPFPAITAQPQGQTVLTGTNVTLTVAAIGSQPLSYSWQFNGTNIVGATNASLVLTNAQPVQSGDYTVVVSNSVGSVTSDPAAVRVRYLFPTGNGQRLTNGQYTFIGSANVSFQSSFAGGMIFYTLDGSTPSFASRMFTGPFALTRSASLRAIVYSSDFSQSGESDPVNITVIPTYTLSGATAGGGSVAISGVGPFLENTVVNVMANASNGWTFLQWLGDATGTNPMTQVAMTRNKSVRAVFGTTFNTTVAGSGVVVQNPVSGLYPFGSVVRLTAVPDAGSFFGIWGNAASGNTNPLDFVIITPNPTVSSLFSALSGGQFALTLSANGFGRVSASPQANSYASGQLVTLTATADTNQTFLGWTGDASGTTNVLTVIMDQSRNITANFTRNPRLTILSTPETVALEGFRFSLNGELGEIYSVQKTSGLTNWTTFVTVTNLFGTTQISDSASTNSDPQFYRAIKP